MRLDPMPAPPKKASPTSKDSRIICVDEDEKMSNGCNKQNYHRCVAIPLEQKRAAFRTPMKKTLFLTNGWKKQRSFMTWKKRRAKKLVKIASQWIRAAIPREQCPNKTQCQCNSFFAWMRLPTGKKNLWQIWSANSASKSWSTSSTPKGRGVRAHHSRILANPQLMRFCWKRSSTMCCLLRSAWSAATLKISASARSWKMLSVLP